MNVKKKVTTIDIARRAGVSQSTVSMILNEKEGVSFSPETKEKVLKAMKELGYKKDKTRKAKRTVLEQPDTDRLSHFIQYLLYNADPRHFPTSGCLWLSDHRSSYYAECSKRAICNADIF